MFGKQVTLFKIYGFKVGIDLSWIVIAVLVVWSLSAGVFPHYFKGLSTATYWWMGVIGAVGLFASIVVHELFHSLVARKFGLSMKGITLFMFGGVAEMEDEPPSAKAELFMAIAGPITSIVLGLIFVGAYVAARALGLGTPLQGIVAYLGWINLILAGFNLIPAFPLDGGRVLRSALWQWKGRLGWATRIASQIGTGFGIVLIVGGVLFFIRGAFIAGLWWILIGWFLRRASQVSYQRILIRRALQGEHVRRFMKTDPITVVPSMTLDRFVEDYIYKYHFKMFPVVESAKIAGCITTKEVGKVPREEWSTRTVGDIAKSCSRENSISPDTDAIKALSLMSRTGESRLMVAEDGNLVGIISLKDLLRFLSVKLDLSGEDADTKGWGE